MANNNFRVESQKFFNAQTGQNHRSWARAAAAYYRQVGSSTKAALPDAMATYFGKINTGAIPAPVQLTATQAVVSNAGTSPVQNSAGSAIGTGTYTVAANAVTNIRLPATVAGISNSGTTNVPITFTTARTANSTATVVATYTVANGVITAITIA